MRPDPPAAEPPTGEDDTDSLDSPEDASSDGPPDRSDPPAWEPL